MKAEGPELYERLMRVLVETMLARADGACLTVTQAYNAFCRLSEQCFLGPLKRSMFREIMRDLIQDFYGQALRRDVPDSFNKRQGAWKGLKLVNNSTLGT
jgi:hypothetical protein